MDFRYISGVARKTETITIITDDLTGETLDGSVRPTKLTYRGTSYSLDLGPESARKLDDALAPFLNASKRTPAKKRSAVEPSAVRAWAIEQGLLEPGSRGRLPKDVLTAYEEQHGARG